MSKNDLILILVSLNFDNRRLTNDTIMFLTFTAQIPINAKPFPS